MLHRWTTLLAGALFVTSTFRPIVPIAVLNVNVPICERNSSSIGWQAQLHGREESVPGHVSLNDFPTVSAALQRNFSSTSTTNKITYSQCRIVSKLEMVSFSHCSPARLTEHSIVVSRHDIV
jgi:hypothetical protein